MKYAKSLFPAVCMHVDGLGFSAEGKFGEIVFSVIDSQYGLSTRKTDETIQVMTNKGRKTIGIRWILLSEKRFALFCVDYAPSDYSAPPGRTKLCHFEYAVDKKYFDQHEIHDDVRAEMEEIVHRFLDILP